MSETELSESSLTKEPLNDDDRTKSKEEEEKVNSVVTEGSANVIFPSLNDVFYNPVQEFNRDMSIAVIQLYAKKNLDLSDSDVIKRKGEKFPEGLTVLEALSASGLRSVRYANEITGLKNILANDWSRQAVASITRNVEANKVSHLVSPNNGDASQVMYDHRKFDKRFKVVDLDPYGSPTLFLDAAVQSIDDGGLLCVTATDMAVLCGNSPESCHAKYGSIPLKHKSCHEMALRIVLNSIETHANRYGRYIKPLLSLSIDFYVRLFVTVHSGQKTVKESTSKLGHVYVCHGCESFAVQPMGQIIREGTNKKYKLISGPVVGPSCAYCGQSHYQGGPFWIAPMHDKEFVNELLCFLRDKEDNYGTHERMIGMLSVVDEELLDVPFYYVQDRLCSLIKSRMGKITSFRSALLNAGFKVSLSHCNKLAIKTDAPNDFIWDMMRAWEKENPANRSKLDPNSPAAKILNAESKNENISFELHENANPASREMGLKRFQVNPEPNWGPKMRATTSIFKDKENDKRAKNQGKFSKKRKLNDEKVELKTNV